MSSNDETDIEVLKTALLFLVYHEKVISDIFDGKKLTNSLTESEVSTSSIGSVISAAIC